MSTDGEEEALPWGRPKFHLTYKPANWSIKEVGEEYQEGRPTTEALCLMANAVYEDPTSAPKGWTLIVRASNRDGYAGAVFLHKESRSLVVAHRGTVVDTSHVKTTFHCIITDMASIVCNTYAPQMTSAVTLMAEVVSKARGFEIYTTGHSLGGWLAQLTAFSGEYVALGEDGTLKFRELRELRGPHVHALAFDSPGAKEMLEKVSRVHLKDRASLALRRLDITTFLSEPNLVNVVGNRVGRVLYLPHRTGLFMTAVNYVARSLGYITRPLGYMTRSLRYIARPFYSAVIPFSGRNSCSDEVDGTPSEEKAQTQSSNPFIAKIHSFFNFLWIYKRESGAHKIARILSALKAKKPKKVLNWKVVITPGTIIKEMDTLDKLELFFRSPKRVHYVEKTSDYVDKSEEFAVCDVDPCKIELRVFDDRELHFVMRYMDFSSGTFKYKDEDSFPVLIEDQEITSMNGEILEEFVRYVKRRIRENGERILEERTEEAGVGEALYRAATSDYRAGKSTLVPRGSKSEAYEDKKKSLDNFFKSNNKSILIIDCDDEVIGDILEHFSGNFTALTCEKLLNIDRSVNVVKNFECAEFVADGILVIDILEYDAKTKDSLKDVLKKLYQSNARIKLDNRDIKKIVLLVKSVIFLDEIGLPTFNERVEKLTWKITWHDLDLQTKGAINKKPTFFQGAKVQFNMICDGALEKISSKGIRFLTEKNEINIGKTVPIPISFYEVQQSITWKEFSYICDQEDSYIIINKRGVGENPLEGLPTSKFEVRPHEFPESFTNIYSTNKISNLYNLEYWIQQIDESFVWRYLSDSNFYKKRRYVIHNEINFGNLKKYAEQNPCESFFIIKGETFAKDKIPKNILLNGTTEAFDEKRPEKDFGVHLLEFKDNTSCFWRKSKGYLNALRTCLKQGPNPNSDNELGVEEGDFLKNYHSSDVVISDVPGMGKSTSIEMLAHSLKKEHPNSWVIPVDMKLNENRLPDEMEVNQVVNFLLGNEADEVSRAVLGYRLQHGLNTGHDLVLFDGFDEVLPSFVQDYQRLIQFIKDHTRAKIWITTRDYKNLRDILENTLCIFATNLTKIDAESMKQYFIRYWDIRTPKDSQNPREDNYEVKAVKLLKAMEELGPSVTDIMGVPLQLNMLAQLFLSQDDPNKLSLFNIYEETMNNKLDIYFTQKVGLNNYTWDTLRKWLEVDLHKKLYLLSLEKKLEKRDLYELCKTGLVYPTGKFFHQTFLEYFRALPYIRNDLHEDLAGRCLPLGKILVEEKHRVVRRFLEDNPERLVIREEDIFVKNENSETLFHVLLQERLFNLFNKLLTALPDIPTEYIAARNGEELTIMNIIAIDRNAKLLETVIGQLKEDTRVELAVSSLLRSEKGWLHRKGVKEVYDMLDQWDGSSGTECMKSFHETCLNVKEKCYRVDKFLNQCELGSLELGETKQPENNSKFEQVIGRYLLKRDYLSDKEYTESALHNAAKKGHLDVIKCLVKKGADINAQNKNTLGKLHNTALHCAIDCNQLEVSEWLIDKADLKLTNFNGRTPLFFAAVYNRPAVLNMLLKREANISDLLGMDKTKLTLLHVAVRHPDKTCFEILKEHTEIMEWADLPDRSGLTPLHYAVKTANNGRSTNPKTEPIDCVLCKSKKCDHKESVKCTLFYIDALLVRGADPFREDNHGRSPVDFATKANRKELLRVLCRNQKLSEKFLQKIYKCLILTKFEKKNSLKQNSEKKSKKKCKSKKDEKETAESESLQKNESVNNDFPGEVGPESGQWKSHKKVNLNTVLQFDNKSFLEYFVEKNNSTLEKMCEDAGVSIKDFKDLSEREY